MISLSIKTEKIEKQHLIEGKNGKILSVVLFENKDGQGKYGDDGFAVQGVSKEARESGIRGVIIGNWRYIGQATAATATTNRRARTKTFRSKQWPQPQLNKATFAQSAEVADGIGAKRASQIVTQQASSSGGDITRPIYALPAMAPVSGAFLKTRHRRRSRQSPRLLLRKKATPC